MVAFTGHRPEKLPWGQDESDPRCIALKQRICDEICREAEAGERDFACGMARGCDLYFAEAVLQAKRCFPHLRLYAYLPCQSQPDRWPSREQSRYRGILAECDGVILIQEDYTPDCMLRRNRSMVDDSAALMSVWDGTRGGTGAAVGYARRQGKRLIPLWL